MVSFAALLAILQLLTGLATGQLEDTVLVEPELDYDILQGTDLEKAPFSDYVPIRNERERTFLEGLVIEAGRHTLFPELYISNRDEESNENSPFDPEESPKLKGSPRFYEITGQPEFEQSYTNRQTRGGRVNCPEECPIYKPVCGSDGKVYPSECHLLKENCGSANVTLGPWDKCRGKHYLCPTRCLDIKDPVCASDGRIYHNICIMRKRNCGKLLQVLPVKKCYDDVLQSNIGDSCPEKCREVPKPVCGSDGVIYFNECVMKMKTCRLGIVEVDMENCVFIPKCPETCIPLYDPVCGSDGKLYINKCRMLKENCGKDVKMTPRSFCSSGGQGSLSDGYRP